MFNFNKSQKVKHMAKYATSAEKQAYLDGFKQSGFTQLEFCENHNIHPKTFNRWLNESVKVSSKVTKRDDPKSHFIHLRLEEKEIEPTLQAPSFLTLKTKVFSLEIPLGLDLEGNDFLKVKAVIQTLHDLA